MGVIFDILFCMWGCILIIRVCCTMWNDLSLKNLTWTIWMRGSQETWRIKRAWDLHSRSWVRVRAFIFCKSPGQPRFYSLTWTYKMRFPENEIFSNPKIKKSERCYDIDIKIYRDWCKSISYISPVNLYQ